MLFSNNRPILCNFVLRPDGTAIVMTLNRRTVLELVRRLASVRRAPDTSGEVPVRRYALPELRAELQAALGPARIRVRPVFVFPRPLRWLEGVLGAIPGLRRLAMPLAVSFVLVAERQAPA